MAACNPLVAVAREGLRLVDISNTFAMRLRGKTEEPWLRRIAFLDNQTVVATGEADSGPEGLFVFDVSDPDDPGLISSYTEQQDPEFHPWDITVDGNLVFVTSLYGFNGGGLFIFDLTTPTAPAFVGKYVDQSSPSVMQQWAHPVRISETLVLGVSGFIGTRLTSIDISDLSNPTLAHTKLFPGSTAAFDLWDLVKLPSGLVAGGSVDYGEGVVLFDVQDPSNIVAYPTYRPPLDWHFNAYHYDCLGVASDGRLFVADTSDYSGGLSLFNVDDPNSPSFLGRVRSQAFPPFRLAVGWQDHVIVAEDYNRASRIAIYDSDLRFVGAINDPGVAPILDIAVTQCPFTSVPETDVTDLREERSTMHVTVDSIRVRPNGAQRVNAGTADGGKARFAGHRLSVDRHDGGYDPEEDS